MASDEFIFLVRSVLALVWLHNGFWDKVIAADASSNVAWALARAFPQQPSIVSLHILGWTETLFAVIIVSGLFFRYISWLQVCILLAVAVIGTLNHLVAHPVEMVITNMPLIMCVMLVGLYGPGSFAIQIHNRAG